MRCRRASLTPLPEYVTKNDRRLSGQGGGFLTHQLAQPDPRAAAAGIGHLTSVIDEDGATRYEPLVIDHYGSSNLDGAVRRTEFELTPTSR